MHDVQQQQLDQEARTTWAALLGARLGALPGTALLGRQVREAYTDFTLNLVPGMQTVETVAAARQLIAMAYGWPPSHVVVLPHPHPHPSGQAWALVRFVRPEFQRVVAVRRHGGLCGRTVADGDTGTVLGRRGRRLIVVWDNAGQAVESRDDYVGTLA
jgi:hypothetical protein